MSLSKFKIVRTGEHFFHDNHTNGLLDSNLKHLSLPVDVPTDYEDLYAEFQTNVKSNHPHLIKITLGHGCNYSCGYCMQKDIGNPDERPPNGLTPGLIKNLRDNFDFSKIERIELWGGETLLYWRDMMPIMEAFDREGLMWYIPTNGTPLMQKHIDFLMQLKGNTAFGISHDGPAHESTRGKEFIHKKVEIFQRIQQECYPKIQFSFNPVISKTNYDLFKINDFFHEFFTKSNLKQTTISYEVGRVYDETMAKNSTHHVISGEHLDRYKVILKAYLDSHLAQFRRLGAVKDGELLANSLFHTGLGVLPYARTLQRQKIPLLKTSCGVDDSDLISMDIYGNIRTCQNTDDNYISGHVSDLKNVKLVGIDLNRDDFCGTCPVYRLCKSSCPLDLGSAVFHTNHAVEYVHYSQIQRTAFKLLFNSEIELVERGIPNHEPAPYPDFPKKDLIIPSKRSKFIPIVAA
jgi:uncharacterized protein